MRSFAIIALAGLLASMTSTCEAALKLKLFDGTTTVIVTDGGVGDSNTNAGEITFIGGVGNWTTNITTGLSDPATPGPYPNLHLTSVDITSAAGGTLTIWLSDDDVGTDPFGPVPGFTTSVGGLTDGTVEAWSFATAGSVDFGEGELVTHVGPLGPGIIGGADSGLSTVAQAGAFTATFKAQIVHSTSGTTSVDAELKPVPEPATLAIWGLGAMGVLVAGRFRRKLA